MSNLTKLPLNVADIRAEVLNQATSSDFKVGVRAEAESVEMMIHGHVGDDWRGLDSGSVAAFLKEHKGKTVNVDINSPGGLAYDGVSIYNALMMHGSPVNIDITGIAASAASIIAMAGDKIRIAENGSFMIHRALAIGIGNTKLMLDLADFLEKLDGQIAATYAARTNRKSDTMLKLMDGAVDGTTFSGPEAVAGGFCDEVIPLKKKPKESGMSNTAPVPTNEAKPDNCNCEYPKVAVRNGSGHAQSCPVHQEWEAAGGFNKKNEASMPISITAVATENAVLPQNNGEMMPGHMDVGNRVIVAGQPHMEGQSAGLIRQVVMGPAYGIQFDGSNEIHKWYVASEIALEDPTEEKIPAMAPKSLADQFAAEANQREADAVKARLGLLKLDDAA